MIFNRYLYYQILGTNKYIKTIKCYNVLKIFVFFFNIYIVCIKIDIIKINIFKAQMKIYFYSSQKHLQ